MKNGQVVNELEALVLKYNSIAMDYLKLENYRDSLSLLKKAEETLNSDENEIIPNRLKLMGITLNNLGCYYKKHRQPKVALNYLEKALEVELQTESDNVNLAGSHLNICAVLSSLSKHREALKHARQAQALLESAHGEETYSFEKTVTLVTSLIITYFNAGVELEHMGKYPDALGYYQIGHDLSKKELGNRHPLTINLGDTIKKVSIKGRAGERLSKSTIRDSKTHVRNLNNQYSNRLPSVPRSRQAEGMPLFKNRLASAYEKLRDMTFQAPL